MNSSKKGFTLVELLVVIGILAILTAAVVVVLNPAELLKQSRDAQRLSDFDALRSAISLYLSTASSPLFNANVSGAYTELTGGASCHGMTAGGACAARPVTAVDGTGWVAINFNELTGVGLSSPVSALPTDPTNSGNYYYAAAFDATNKYYELDSILESSKYGGATGRMATDGGSSTTLYEVGNAPGLAL